VTGASGQPGRPRKHPCLADGDGRGQGSAPSGIGALEPLDFWHLAPIYSSGFSFDSLSIGQLPTVVASYDTNFYVDPLFQDLLWDDILILPLNTPPRAPAPGGIIATATASLVRFREEMDQRVALVDAYFTDPFIVLQRSQQELHGSRSEMDNPAALSLTCSQKFINMVQSLAPACRLSADTEEDITSTETLLLALSGYLAPMRLYDTLFHCVFRSSARCRRAR
jgi:hypothetical protein